MSYTLQYLDDVRRQIAPNKLALEVAAERRDKTRAAGEKFNGALRSFMSGSLAHRTANCPVHRRDAGLDADSGLVLDRRHWTWLGPGSALGEGPTEVVDRVVAHLREQLLGDYPKVVLEPTKRAILIQFNEPLPEGEDPTVDLVVALGRAHAPGLWIPNTKTNSWDASHPEEHTRLLTAEPRSLRLVRQHAIRLAKAENKREEDVPLCSFNLESFGLSFVRAGMNDAEALRALWQQGAADLRARETPDPAKVSAPIKVEDRSYAVRRLETAASHLGAALDHDWDQERVRKELYPLWPEYIPTRIGQSTKADLVAATRKPKPTLSYGASGLTTTAVAGAAAVNGSVRSYGQARY